MRPAFRVNAKVFGGEGLFLDCIKPLAEFAIKARIPEIRLGATNATVAGVHGGVFQYRACVISRVNIPAKISARIVDFRAAASDMQ